MQSATAPHLRRYGSGALTTSGHGAISAAQLFSNPGAAAAAAAASAPPPSLNAKPFQLDNTLLRDMAKQQQNQQEQQQQQRVDTCVLDGFVVADCAAWVQDLRQPTRDVCMLMASRNTTTAAAPAPAAAAAAIPSQLSPVDGTAGAMLSACSTAGEPPAGPSGARSLVLLGLDVGDGAVLGLYLAFPTRLPARLLASAKDSCARLLRTVRPGKAFVVAL